MYKYDLTSFLKSYPRTKKIFVLKPGIRFSLIRGIVILNRKSELILFVWSGRWNIGVVREGFYKVLKIESDPNPERKSLYGWRITLANEYLKIYMESLQPCTNEQSDYLNKSYGLQKDTALPELSSEYQRYLSSIIPINEQQQIKTK